MKDLDLSKTVMVTKRDFIDVMRAWSSYEASDYNQVHRLNVKELKILLWIYEDQEPDDFYVLNQLVKIDKDCSGDIDRVEWMSFLC